jgi:rRNA-processing protein FCF1
MVLASKRIKNIPNLETEIGTIEYVIPNMVEKELERLSGDNKKKVLLKML